LNVTHTRYKTTNTLLLIAGGLVCLFTTFLAVMTAGFGADPAHDFKSYMVVGLLFVSLASVPSYLLMFRWCGIGEAAMWVITAIAFFLMLLGGMNFFGLVLSLIIESLIFSGIASGSRRESFH
jgi:hypothetical protein